jgi:hypothetical protein
MSRQDQGASLYTDPPESYMDNVQGVLHNGPTWKRLQAQVVWLLNVQGVAMPLSREEYLSIETPVGHCDAPRKATDQRRQTT